MDSKLLLIIATLALTATTFMALNQKDSNEMTQAFENFKQKHGKEYSNDEEEAYRFAIYVQNMNKINTHNAKKASYTMAENHMTDLSNEEFKAIYLGF